MERKGNSNIIVAKIGTDTLVRDGKVDDQYALNIAEQIGRVCASGKSVVLVSSGARALGGQWPLTFAWERAFGNNGISCLLYTSDAADE